MQFTHASTMWFYPRVASQEVEDERHNESYGGGRYVEGRYGGGR